MNANVYSYALEGLEACRVCLTTDIKLYDLHKFGLSQMFLEFTGTPISSTDGLPQQICIFCSTLLKKSSEFRNKCRNAHTILLNHLLQLHCLTTSYIKTIENHNLKLSLNISKTEATYFPQECDQDTTLKSIKQELSLDCVAPKDPIEDFYDENYANNYDSFIFDNPSVKSEDGLIFVINDSKKIKKKKRKDKIKDKLNNKKVLSDKDNENIIEFEKKYIDDTIDPGKKLFYEYILGKYLKRTSKYKNKKVKYDPAELNEVKTEENPFKSTDNSNFIENNYNITDLYNNTKESTRKRFYEHILEKYTKNNSHNVGRKKITDVTRMREKKNKKTKRRSRTKDELANFSKTYNVEVVVLNREEQIADVISRKETEKYKKAKFKCEDCCRGFTLEKAFQNHVAIHDPSTGPHVCEVCRVRFALRGRLTKHLQLRHKYKFICRLCGQVTRNSTCAREHYKCHAGFKYECEHCGKVFSKYGSRINHIRIFHGSATCDICQESFAGDTGLLAHKTKAHRELFKCTSCGVQFHNPAALNKHAETAVDGCGPHIRPCTQCGDNFLDEVSLREHMLQYHNKQKPRLRGQTKPTISLPASPRPAVRWRARRAPRPAPRPASGALAGAAGEVARGRGAEQRFMCEMCAADGFASEAVLRYHQRIHTGEKPHPCPHCPKRFRIRELLQKHLRTHTGDRPYACAHCPKAFKTASAHYTHQVVHTKIRRHRCHICEKTFLTSTCVRTHIKTVHMKIPANRTTARERPDDEYIGDVAGY